ncbi:retron St85 family RNA-directed DNA polymerase [Lelliottia wanjuensis]|uniref:retron St85 family RNA-directed DNA polymerase n=1 Tax=Lelliottia wanjuensis TaxID=3050585 RepID=UPI0025500046|nr:retron St85 family RNA-directed DNA polymerase [Lelliottia sp. V104_15]MDK9606310.1 retron St85 family RNA-directed DNA polymerase [Lelliottia sp. V104_15]
MDILQHISDLLLSKKSEIVAFSMTAPYRYKIYRIPKRNSLKKRTIAHPSKELKFIQRAITEYLSDKLPVHECAFAYKKGSSIKNNAQIHLHTKYLLKMDFENFFPSITPRLFFSKLRLANIELTTEDKVILENILFFKSKRNSNLRLSIGAPSSPLISNFVMYFWDIEVQKLCSDMGINYTRYADDLTFSTNNKNILFDIPEMLENILPKYSLGKIRINHGKTIFSSKGHNRHVTGITLTNDNKLSIGRERKRLISSMIHYFINGKLAIDDVNKLIGLLAFAKNIEPSFYESMAIKYGYDNLSKLRKRDM